MRKLRTWLRLLVRLTVPLVDVPHALRSALQYPGFISKYRAYRRLTSEKVTMRDLYPCLGEITSSNPVEPFMYESYWTARQVLNVSPAFHVDIGSQVFFVLMLAIRIRTVFVDVRPVSQALPNLAFVQGSIAQLPFASNSVPSISCLSVAEHIGLGRYDNALDPLGTQHAAEELSRALAPGGRLYFSLPLGMPRVLYNAHRVHYPEQIVRMFPSLQLLDFALVDDTGTFKPEATFGMVGKQDCPSGMFLFTK